MTVLFELPLPVELGVCDFPMFPVKPVFFIRFLIVGIPKLILHIRLKINISKSNKMANDIDLVLDSIRNQMEIEAKEAISALSEKHFTSSSINSVANELNQMINLWQANAQNINEFNLIINKSDLKFMFYGKAIENCPDDIIIDYSQYNLPTLNSCEEYFALGATILTTLSQLSCKNITLYAKYQHLYFSKDVKNEHTTFLHRYLPYEYDGYYQLNEDLFATKLTYQKMCDSIECDKHELSFKYAEFNIKSAD